MSQTPKSHPQRPGRPADLTEWEITTEDVALTVEQGQIGMVLSSSLSELAAMRGWGKVLVLGNNYFAWIPERPMVRVRPDAYLLDHRPERLPTTFWKTWLPGNPPPRWALEIVLESWPKEYGQDPVKYEELGCRELVVFDPDAYKGLRNLRRLTPLTVYRRTDEGKLALEYSGRGPAFSRELGVWLVPLREGYRAWLRLSEDEAGTRLVPTDWEKSAALRAETAAIKAETAELKAETAALENLEPERGDNEPR